WASRPHRPGSKAASVCDSSTRSSEYTSWMIVLLLGFATSLFTTFFIVRSARTHSHFSGDSDMTGPQKFHAMPVPRVGGLGIIAGLSAALVALWIWQGVDMTLGITLLVCSTPA